MGIVTAGANAAAKAEAGTRGAAGITVATTAAASAAEGGAVVAAKAVTATESGTTAAEAVRAHSAAAAEVSHIMRHNTPEAPPPKAGIVAVLTVGGSCSRGNCSSGSRNSLAFPTLQLQQLGWPAPHSWPCSSGPERSRSSSARSEAPPVCTQKARTPRPANAYCGCGACGEPRRERRRQVDAAEL